MPKPAKSNDRPSRETSHRPRTVDAAFLSEAQLVEAIQSVFDARSSVHWAWLKELNSPSGIADLVAVALNKNWQQNRSLSSVPTRWLYALKRMTLGSTVTAESFAAEFGVSGATARGVLTAYTEASYCEYSSADRAWLKKEDPEPLAERIVAIEAKLRNWRRALYQAVQYASFASESWVVIDAHYLNSMDVHMDEFERRGIGLLALSTNGEGEVICAAAPHLPRMPERFWQANGEISKRLLTANERVKTC